MLEKDPTDDVCVGGAVPKPSHRDEVGVRMPAWKLTLLNHDLGRLVELYVSAIMVYALGVVLIPIGLFEFLERCVHAIGDGEVFS